MAPERSGAILLFGHCHGFCHHSNRLQPLFGIPIGLHPFRGVVQVRLARDVISVKYGSGAVTGDGHDDPLRRRLRRRKSSTLNAEVAELADALA